MKFARGLVIASVIAGSVPLAAACGSAPDSNLFSSSGNGSGRAGATNAHAGTHAVGGDESGGAGSSNGSGGNTSGDAGEGNGSSGAPAGGTSNGEAGKAGDAGEAGGGAVGGGAAGASAGGAGASGASAGGATAGGAALGGAGSGGAGSGGAGSSGAGGSGASVGGAGGASAGGAGTGGAGAGGAGAGGASAGGAGAAGGGGGNSCPALAPVDNTECKVSTPSSCFYGGVACSCLAAGGPGPGTTRKWACYGTPDKCPSAKPTAGNACKQNLGAECPYPNQDYCICKGDAQDATWVCQAPTATCLANKPPQHLGCGSVRTCEYSDVSCFCNASNWSCLGG